MAYSIRRTGGKMSSLQEECEYLSSLIQQYKQAPAANLKTHGSVNASVSKYKKVNVSKGRHVPLVGARRMCGDNGPPQSNKMDAGSPTSTLSNVQENQPLKSGTQSDECQVVFDSRSSRLYLNPHFSKANISLQRNATAKHMASESAIDSTSKHSVHINPKVLAEQVLKLTTQSRLTQVGVISSTCGTSNKQGMQLQTRELLLEPSAAHSLTTKYTFHSKTKLVKHNVAVQQSNTRNRVRNSGTSLQVVSKRKFSPPVKSSLPGPLMSISRTKMVRAKSEAYGRSLQGLAGDSASVCEPDDFPTHPKSVRRSSVSSCFRIRRNSFKSSTVVMKAAKAVCSKYKLTRSSMSKTPVTKSVYSYVTNKGESSQVSRYKIDRRLYKTPKRLKNVKRYSLRYRTPKRGKHNQQNVNPKHFSKHKHVQYSFTGLKFGNRTWNKCLQPRKVMIMENKLRRIGNSPNVRKSSGQDSIRQNSSLVWIGGVLYRTSKLKLTRSLTPKCKNEGGRSRTNLNVKKSKARSSFAVYVRGNKFLMDATGKTLLRVPQRATKNAVNGSPTRNMPLKRIDIGGVTFVQKSTNVLVRTNTHNARSLLSQAKQKSIAFLTNKLKKSNQPCTFYHRFGKCVRMEKGTCPHVHDPKHVAVCKKFLQGCCTVTGCTLSHDVGPEKMATCKYFLEGCCVRDDCPYLHVKVNAKAGICTDFLRGYCPDGQKCRKRHTYICPDFERAGSCPKGKYCPYPHKTVVKKMSKCQTHSARADKPHVPAGDERKRYYETGGTVSLELGTQVACEVDSSDLNVKRLKLLKKVDDMKRAWQNAEDHADRQMGAAPDLMHESGDTEAKRPKLGILPAYIPLGSST